MHVQGTTIKVPLVQRENDTIFVEGTRVPLDTVIYLYNEGATPEEIVDRFTTLKLADVYFLFAYYIKYKTELDLYLAKRETERQEVRREIEARSNLTNIRERLLARGRQKAKQ